MTFVTTDYDEPSVTVGQWRVHGTIPFMNLRTEGVS